MYRFLLATHIIVSVAWLGIVSAKLVLGLAAVAADTPAVSQDLLASTEVVNVAFPPVAIATLASSR